MGLEDLVIIKILKLLANDINKIEVAIFKGLSIILFYLILAWFILYFLIWSGLNGHWLRTVIIVGILLLIELAHFIGGGHSH